MNMAVQKRRKIIAPVYQQYSDGVSGNFLLQCGQGMPVSMWFPLSFSESGKAGMRSFSSWRIYPPGFLSSEGHGSVKNGNSALLLYRNAVGRTLRLKMGRYLSGRQTAENFSHDAAAFHNRFRFSPNENHYHRAENALLQAGNPAPWISASDGPEVFM